MSLHELVRPDSHLHRAPPPPANDTAPVDPEQLVRHILNRYHETHRREFPEAIRLARKVEAVHAGDPRAPVGLADHLSIMLDELEGHQQKEERVLFPMILAGGSPMVRFPIARMMAEHVEVEQQLVRLADLTNRFEPPADACRSWVALCRLCRTLNEDLGEHMRLENEVLFAPFLR